MADVSEADILENTLPEQLLLLCEGIARGLEAEDFRISHYDPEGRLHEPNRAAEARARENALGILKELVPDRTTPTFSFRRVPAVPPTNPYEIDANVRVVAYRAIAAIEMLAQHPEQQMRRMPADLRYLAEAVTATREAVGSSVQSSADPTLRERALRRFDMAERVSSDPWVRLVATACQVAVQWKHGDREVAVDLSSRFNAAFFALRHQTSALIQTRNGIGGFLTRYASLAIQQHDLQQQLQHSQAGGHVTGLQ